MPDTSGDPPPSPPQPSGASRPAAPAGEPAPLMPAPRLHPPHPRQQREPQAPPPPPGLSEVLEWMQRHGTAGAPDADSPEEKTAAKSAPRSHLSKEQRKFHKFDPDHPEPESPKVREPRTPGGSTENEAPFADYPGSITSEQIAYIRRLREQAGQQTPWLAVGLAVLFFLLVVAMVVGYATLPKFRSVTTPPDNVPEKSAKSPDAFAALPAETLALIDQAMTAEKAKDYLQAIDALERAQHAGGHVYGANYRLATLRYRANDVARVLPLLNLSIAEGEEVAACHSFRGLLSGQPNQTDHGPSDLEKATQLDPFSARHLFVWGEALRRAGNVAQALVEFRRAAERVRDPGLAEAYALKVRLTQIELGQQEDFTGEMTAKLGQTPPPLDWVLTAAAVEMHRSNFPAAAEYLAKGRSLIGAPALAQSLQDAFFVGFAHESEVASFFELPASADSVGTP